MPRPGRPRRPDAAVPGRESGDPSGVVHASRRVLGVRQPPQDPRRPCRDAGRRLQAEARTVWENWSRRRPPSLPDSFRRCSRGAKAGSPMSTTRSAELDQPRIAFTLGLWIKDPKQRHEQARALLSAIADAYPEWPTPRRPFVRPLHDLATLVTAVSVNEDGSPRYPAARRLWERAFEGQDLPEDPARQLRDSERSGSIDCGLPRTGHRDGRCPRARTTADAARLRVPRVRRRHGERERRRPRCAPGVRALPHRDARHSSRSGVRKPARVRQRSRGWRKLSAG